MQNKLQQYIKDRKALIGGIFNIISALIIIILTFLRVEARDYTVPVRYNQYSRSDIELGPWYNLYEFALFALVVTLMNLVFSIRLHADRKNLAYALLLLNAIILVFLLMVMLAVTRLNT